MKSCVHAIIYQDEFSKIEALEASFRSLADNGPVGAVSILAKSSPDPSLISVIDSIAGRSGIPKVEFAQLHGRSWYEAINECRIDAEYLLLLACGAVTEKGCLEKLLEALATGDIAGANPVLLQGLQARVSHLGYVADSQMRLHSLYEGAAWQNPLVRKWRYFQLAHPAMFLVRQKDFRACGGFNPRSMQLAFFDLCKRLVIVTGKRFATVPDAFAIYDNRLEALVTSGLWNSLVMRGKLKPDTLAPDYHALAMADGLEYGVTEWLHETCENAGIWDGTDPWLAWRHDPEPSSFLAWLAALPEARIAGALAAARGLPAIFPAQFRYYEALALRLKAFASHNQLEVMAGRIAGWQRSCRNFHYRKLRAGMEALVSAGIYNSSLDGCPASYDAWLELVEPGRSPRLKIGHAWPTIALVMPVYNPDPAFLAAALDSVRAQSYGNWQLCVADDASTLPGVREFLVAAASGDARIKLVFRPENGHICHATNSAISLVDAPWTAFMDNDDLLAPQALALVAGNAHDNPGLRLIYSDEDKIDANGARRSPIFRSSSLLNLRGHLMAYDTALLREVGGVRPGCEGAQDFDLNLRVQERISHAQSCHIPHILYHWRIHEGSTAGTIQSKSYVVEAIKKAVADSLESRGGGRIAATKSRLFYLPLYNDNPVPDCAVVVLDEKKPVSPAMSQALDKLRHDYGLAIHFLPLVHGSSGSGWIGAWQEAAQKIRNDFLFFLSSSLSPLPDCRPVQLLLSCERLGAALAGSLIWKHGRLWNGGLYPDVTGLPFPLLKNESEFSLKELCWQEFLAMREVLAIPWQSAVCRREFLLEGLNAEMGHYTLTDFCLRQLAQGRHVLVSPWSQWEIAWQRADDRPEKRERDCFMAQWSETVATSGLRNPNIKAAPDNNWGLIF